ncbi:MAG: hypothetical protein JW797_01255 [Bradymonadales bacterium]|nr:hypothetical protein [Bradymonadales bacterium]
MVRFRGTATFLLFVLIGPLLVGVGCGDEGDQQYSVYIAISGGVVGTDGIPTLDGGGSETASITIQVVDQDGSPAPDGSEIVVLGTNLSTAARTGMFGLDGVQQMNLALSQGSASTTFVCSEMADVRIDAYLREPQVSGNANLKCIQRYTGNWYIENPLTLDPDQVLYLSNSQIEVRAHALQPDEEGGGSPQAVPPGTRVLFRVTDSAGNYTSSLGGFGTDHRQEQTRSTNLTGWAEATFTTGAISANTVLVITAQFENESMGCGVECDAEVSFTVRPGGTSIRPGISITPQERSLPANGTSQTPVSVFVYDIGDLPASNALVHFSLNNGILSAGSSSIEGDASFSETLSVAASELGAIDLTYTAGLNMDMVQIKAWAAPEWFNSGPTERVEGSAQLTLVDIDTILFLGASAECPLGIAGSGVTDQRTLFFQVLDSNDEPFPAGHQVDFVVVTTSTGAHVVPTYDLTDENGEVSTTMYAGTNYGTVRVTAQTRLTPGSRLVSQDTDSCLIAGAIPSRGGMTLSCTYGNIGALRYMTGSAIATPSTGNLCTPCSLSLRDRYGNPIGITRQVEFLAESGRFFPQSVAENDTSGNVSIQWCADGILPRDVDPFLDEPSWIESGTSRIRNPRDGLVTIVAWVMGEEEFDDRNRNGLLDNDEVHWDLSEPYVDCDDDDGYDTGTDLFRDVQGVAGYVDGVFDEPNGEHDLNVPIWVQTRVLLTGSPDHLHHTTSPISFTDFTGVDAATAPDSLALDADYPSRPYPLSHWYVIPASGGTGLNRYYPRDDPSYTCTGPDSFCFQTPSPWSDLTYNVYYVARDYFGNPINPTCTSFTPAFDRQTCTTQIRIEAATLSPTGNGLPFDFDLVKDNGDLPPPPTGYYTYHVEVSGFLTGTSQRFQLSPSGSSVDIPEGGCALSFSCALSACPTCGDPVDTAPWPYFLMLD